MPCGERELVGVDDHVRVGELAELQQLRVGERGLLGAAARDHEHLADAAALELLERVVGDVGERELGVREDQHARDVERDVAGADHDRALAARGRSRRSRKSGWPLYQPTKSVAE